MKKKHVGRQAKRYDVGNGRKMTVPEIVKITGISEGTIYGRINRGTRGEKLIAQPVKPGTNTHQRSNKDLTPDEPIQSITPTFHQIDLRHFNIHNFDKLTKLRQTPALILTSTDATVSPSGALATQWQSHTHFKFWIDDSLTQFVIQLSDDDHDEPLPQSVTAFVQPNLYQILTHHLCLSNSLQQLFLPLNVRTSSDLNYQFDLVDNQAILQDQTVTPLVVSHPDVAAASGLPKASLPDGPQTHVEPKPQPIIKEPEITKSESASGPVDNRNFWELLSLKNRTNAQSFYSALELSSLIPLPTDTLLRLVRQLEFMTNYRFKLEDGLLRFTRPGDVQLFNTISTLATKNHMKLSATTELTPEFLHEVLLDLKNGNHPQKTKGSIEPTDPNQFLVKRRSSGASIGTQYYVNESITRKFDLNEGDLVTVGPWSNGEHHDYPNIVAVKHQNGMDPYVRFDYALVTESNDGCSWVIKENFNHVPIKLNGTPTVCTISKERTSKFITDGALVTVAWPKDATDFSKANISWLYRDGDDYPKTPASTDRVKTTSRSTSSKKNYQPKLDYDLSNKTVLIIGYGAHFGSIEPTITAHGGTALNYDGKNGGFTHRLRKYVADADYVVVLLHSSSHHDANTAIELAKTNRVPYAVTSGLSSLEIEKAIYRAVRNLPAYEAVSGKVDYQLVK